VENTGQQLQAHSSNLGDADLGEDAANGSEVKATSSKPASINGDQRKKTVAAIAKKQEPVPSRAPVEVSVRTLLQAGVHFGHQTSRWNPQMAHFIYGTRNGIHIIDLPKSLQCWLKARQAIVNNIANGGTMLFVGTKKQAQEVISEEARRCGAFFVSRRWLGGMITNFKTIRKSIDRMKKVEQILHDEQMAAENNTPHKFTKKERLMMTRELEKLEHSLGGIRDMTSHPTILFVVDVRREDIAVREAQRLDIPVVALVDSNCDPNFVPYPIPSNDDGTRAIRLYAAAVCDAVVEGRALYASRKRDEKKSNANSEQKSAEAKVENAATTAELAAKYQADAEAGRDVVSSVENDG